MNSEFRSCVKDEVAALGSPSLNSLYGRKATLNLNAVKLKDLHIFLHFEACCTYLIASVPLKKRHKAKNKTKQNKNRVPNRHWRWTLGTSPKAGKGNYPQMASIESGTKLARLALQSGFNQAPRHRSRDR